MNRPLVIAHRGVPFKQPENTLPSFQAAIDSGADALELDITISAVGELVVIHDDTLTRTTAGEGFVSHMTAQQLAEIPVEINGKRFPDCHIPTLTEVLNLVGKKLRLNIEIKPFFPVWKAQELQHSLLMMIKELKRRRILGQTIISSSNFFILEYLRSLDDAIRIGLIYQRPITDYDPVYVCKLLDAKSFHPYHRQVTQEMLDEMHALDVRVYTWTVNREPDMKRLTEMGIDGMFTDKPSKLIEVLNGMGL